MIGPNLLAKPSPGDRRDAVHIAITPAIAHRNLKPGEWVGISEDGKTTTEKSPANRNVGVVSPFGPTAEQGEPVWLMLTPNTVTGLRHSWYHPSFPEEAQEGAATKARDVITHMAEQMGVDFYFLMDAANTWISHDDYTYDNSERYKEHFDPAKFWPAYATLTGEPLPKDLVVPFTCSC